MKKFFDVVKVNIDEDIEKYFKEVEVESIKKTRDGKALNFYLVSKDLIPYDVIKRAEKNVILDLFNLTEDNLENDLSLLDSIHFNLRYELDSKWTCKLIFEQTKNDIFKELKDYKTTLRTFIKDDYIEWTNDNTMQLGFDQVESFKSKQFEIVNYLKALFLHKYGRTLDINILWLENDYNISKDSENTLSDDSIKKERYMMPLPSSNRFTHSRERKGKIIAEGDILLHEGKRSHTKHKFLNLADLIVADEIIETSGIIYNLKKFVPKNKDFIIFSIFITDNKGCVEIKFFGNKDDEKLFYVRFKIGDEIKVEGKMVDDNWEKALILKPSYITKLSHRTVIEFGKLEDDDYYNEIVTDRTDDENIKRVELHLHTKSSAQDGIGDVSQYIETARKFGMKAMAITDHGCVNALADAYTYIEEKKIKDFKIINGVEGYLVEDVESYYYDSFGNEIDDSFSFDGDYVIYELIVTGHNKKNDAVIKIIAKKIRDKRVIDDFAEFVYYDKPLSYEVKDRTQIMSSNVENAEPIKIVLEKLIEFAGDAVFVTSNKNSNWKLNELLRENGIDKNYKFLDFVIISRLFINELKTVRLNSIAKALNVKAPGIKDKNEKKSGLTIEENLLFEAEIFAALLYRMAYELEIDNLCDLKKKLVIDDEFIKKQKYYHIIILAKNDVGRVNLYKLVSDSHILYMSNISKKPRIPRSLLQKYREGLIIGSACILGEFMNAVKDNIDDYKLKEIASFYDYLEIQPTLNNSFLLTDESNNFKNIKDLEDLNKKVIKIGEELNKLVVATCDCHYVDKEDKIYREILRAGIMSKKTKQDKDGNVKKDVSAEFESSNQELLYFRTTREMLDEFSYLGVDKAYEVVVKNTNLINDMIETVYPVRPDNCPPHIEGSDDELINSCNTNLVKTYGDKPLPIIKERLDNELKYIIDNGYSVMYIAAKKLIDYSKEFGYPVGSRGSVGSSLAATLSGVSEVNPLKPHYICPKCHHIEYDTEETREYNNESGFDMPDKICPECGTSMNKNGVNIPFETFLGIPGDVAAHKEPDIDLNFCSVFQSKIHEKTIDLFGEKNTFKAGTVGTVASKTAYGYVMSFKEMAEVDLNKYQIDYYKYRIVECKNTTGQHPGGMIVVPDGEEIYTFTPINIAADKEGNNITTHFDYHKIDKNLLKLDILGHFSPLMLKKLSELTGVDFNTVPFYEKEVLDLFKSTESLGISPDDISGTKLGCLTIPEFGTDMAMSMCLDAKPETVADLIKISGLAHGTNVWKGNVQDLIKNGDCTLKTAICCRDDIMIYLQDKGLDSGLAFNIMEKVRKGKGLTDEYKKIMREHDVPEWYIGCCDKIKYMFPKAHAAAYVLASLRIAYYKVHYPIEYYTVYFSLDKDGFDYKLMMKDREEIHYHIEKITRIINDRGNRDKKFAEKIKEKQEADDPIKKMYRKLNGDEDEEEVELDEETLINVQYESMSASKLFDLYMCCRHVEEMKARGIDFCPLDIYKAKRSDFQIVDGKIMPSFDSLSGIGIDDAIDFDENVIESDKSTAMRCEIEGRKGEYTSIENFMNRTKVNKKCIGNMKELGIFKGLRDKEETTIFDFLNQEN